MMQQAIGLDGFLGNLHCMLLMDDTILLATSREMCQRKFDVLLQFCDEYGMEINQKKTQLMVINGSHRERQPIISGEHIVEHCDQYTYLGATFTANGTNRSLLEYESRTCQSDVNKFSVFVAKNTTMPYVLKKKVANAAILTSMLYSSESWLTDNLQKIERHYHAIIKILLGVRNTTANLLCLAEVGFTELSVLVRERRRRFLLSKLTNPDMDEPFVIQR